MEKIAKLIASEMIQFKIIPDDNDIFECYVYGLQLVISATLTFIFMILLATFSGFVPECIIFTAFFCPLRSLTGGYHCKRYLSCFILSLTFWMILVFMLIFNISSHIIVLSFLILIAEIYILFYAPMEHKNNPLSSEEMKVLRKHVLILLLFNNICYFLFIRFRAYDYAFILSYSMIVISSLMIKEKLGGDKNEKGFLKVSG